MIKRVFTSLVPSTVFVLFYQQKLLSMRFVFLFLIGFLAFNLTAQESKLAQQYYQSGEYEKAASVYEKLYAKNANNDYYFNRYIDCLINLEQYDNCEKVIKKQIKKQPKSVQLYVTYGNLFERQFRDAEANEQYDRAIKKLSADRYITVKLANAFVSLTKYDLATRTYERGAELLKDKNIFAYNLGDLYRRKGDTNLMIANYLNSLKDNPSRVNSLKTMFQRYLVGDEQYEELQIQLYDRIQENEDLVEYVELLTWVFIQKKDYRNAFRQVKALDKRLEENGGRIYKLAGIAANDKDYDSAIAAYDYIVSEKGENSSYYIEAKRESLTCRRNKIVQGFDYTREDLLQLEQAYEGFLAEFGSSRATASIIAELADLEAFYLNDIDKAIGLLSEMVELPGVDKNVKARAKLSLGDFYLIQGERWESTLLYSQVDKEFKDDIMGHEARLRNAKLSYYFADFQWAQAQFDILKASTSKLISNDAIDLSVFIMDNLGLDTTIVAMQLYSEAELLIFQNRFPEAFQKLDTLQSGFNEHSLKDDVYYAEAKIYVKKREYTKAAERYQQIIDNHIEEIRADNALFELAQLYENEAQLNDPQKAQELYERLFLDFSGSTFAVEARKRYRLLRGDDI